MAPLKIEKRVLATMNRCYAVNHVVVDGQLRVLVATEGEGPCLAWTAPRFDRPHVVWEGPGGTMSVVPIPGTNGEFLAVQKFFRMFQWDQAKVVHVRPLAGERYEVHDLLYLPYIHRFDLLPSAEGLQFIGNTIATHKETKDDWRHPGEVWTGPYRGAGALQLTLLRDGITKNHGYSRFERAGRTAALVTGEEGAFVVEPPRASGAPWSIEPLMDWPISDIAALDIDGDGELEFATIEPFHGPHFRVYKGRPGAWQCVFEHPEVSDFYHVAVATTLRGEPVFIGGCRRGRQQLFALRAASTTPLVLQPELIDEGVGPSNVHVVHLPDHDVIVSANREKAEVAIYRVC